jgi:hypothetical protein
MVKQRVNHMHLSPADETNLWQIRGRDVEGNEFNLQFSFGQLLNLMAASSKEVAEKACRWVPL